MSGNYIESFASKHLLSEEPKNTGKDIEDLIKWASEGLFVGGGDTVSFLFFNLVCSIADDILRRSFRQ